MHNLYARFLPWLRRMAFQRPAAESIDPQAVVVQIVLDDLRKNGRLARALRGMVSPACSVPLQNRGGWPTTAHARPIPQPVVPAKPGDKVQIGPLDV